MKKYILPLLICALAFSSCSTKDEDPYAREQKEIDEYLSSDGLNVYKAFKVSIRGTKTVGQDTAFDNARMQLFAITGYMLQAAADTTKSIDVMEAANTLADAKPAIDELLKKDEDSLPTVMQNISFVIQPGAGEDPRLNDSVGQALGDLFTESEEHLLLGGLWFAGAHAHPDLALYEMNRVQSGDVRGAEFQCLSEMLRCLLYLNNKWPYHAEKSGDALVALTETQKDALMNGFWPAVDANGNDVTPEQRWHQVHGLAYLMRGMARYDCEEEEKKEQGLDDLSLFVSEAEAGGFDDQLVDYVGLLVALEKENNDDALKYIAKLEARPQLTQDEKDLVAEIKTYVTDKKMDEAKEAGDDGGLLAVFAGKAFATQFMNMPAVKKLKASEGGKKFISITEIKAESVLPAEGTMDSLAKDAEGLMDKVLH